MKRRDTIGPFVITRSEDLDPRGPTCAACERLLAVWDSDPPSPPPEELVAAGRIAIANFGWFCDQKCAEIYEREAGITFARDKTGRIGE
jgi:hypothetical protein